MDLLHRTRSSLLSKLTSKKDKLISGVEFQNCVFEEMCVTAINTKFHNTVKLTGPHSFPDIVARKLFGVEVKVTIGDKWTSVGNSVLESTRVEDTERIFLFFGKFGNSVDIKYRSYQECLTDIAVTHSPRYLINMELPKGKSIFDKIGVEYNVLRKNPRAISLIKEYYKSKLREGEELWWIDPEQELSTRPIIGSLRSLDKNIKEQYMIETMIFFPEIFGGSTLKFERAATYLVMNYNTISSNLRDLFTAGGMQEVRIGSKVFKISKILKNLYSRINCIRTFIRDIDSGKLIHYWRVPEIKKDRFGQWIELLETKGVLSDGLSFRQLVEAALNDPEENIKLIGSKVIEIM